MLIVVSHPEVIVNPDVPIPDWGLSAVGRRRAVSFASGNLCADCAQIWCSAERKARETADVIAAARSLSVHIDRRLGENDRSATGFMPREEFERAADAFFEHPQISFRGWETAVDAQSRIVGAVREIVQHSGGENLMIVTHGAVGTLLWCALSEMPIDRRHDQPFQGHYWVAERPNLRPETGWIPLG